MFEKFDYIEEQFTMYRKEFNKLNYEVNIERELNNYKSNSRIKSLDLAISDLYYETYYYISDLIKKAECDFELCNYLNYIQNHFKDITFIHLANTLCNRITKVYNKLYTSIDL